VRNERVRGKLAFTRVGKRIFYTQKQITEYLERQSVEACAVRLSNGKPKAGPDWQLLAQQEVRTGKEERTRGYRTWYDKASRQTCRVSLGTADFQEASLALGKLGPRQRQG